MLPQGPLSSWVAKMNMFRTLLLSANSRPSGYLHIFNLIYLVEENANAKLSCSSRSCAGSCLPETLPALSCQSWWLCCAQLCLTLGEHLATEWSRSRSHFGFGASLSCSRWGLKYFIENLQVSLCEAQIQSPENDVGRGCAAHVAVVVVLC